MIYWILALVCLALLLGAVATAWLQRRALRHREDFEALAARRGLTLNITDQSLGRPAMMRLASRGAPNWEARSHRLPGALSLRGSAQQTDYSAAEPKWPAGYVFIGAAPALLDLTPHPDEGSLDGWIQSTIIGDGMGADLNGLTRFDSPEQLIVVATQDPRLRVDLRDIAKLWTAWSPPGPANDNYPIAMLGPEGLRVRLPHGTHSADQMETFIDLSLAITRIIGPGSAS